MADITLTEDQHVLAHADVMTQSGEHVHANGPVAWSIDDPTVASANVADPFGFACDVRANRPGSTTLRIKAPKGATPEEGTVDAIAIVWINAGAPATAAILFDPPAAK